MSLNKDIDDPLTTLDQCMAPNICCQVHHLYICHIDFWQMLPTHLKPSFYSTIPLDLTLMEVPLHRERRFNTTMYRFLSSSPHPPSVHLETTQAEAMAEIIYVDNDRDTDSDEDEVHPQEGVVTKQVRIRTWQAWSIFPV